jgi:hypothetical protein
MKKNTNFNVVLLRNNKINETLIYKKRFSCDGFNKDVITLDSLAEMTNECVDYIENKLKWKSIHLLCETTRLDIPQTNDIIKTNIEYYIERDKYDENCKIVFYFNNKPIVTRIFNLNPYQFKLRDVISSQNEGEELTDELIKIFNNYYND